MVTVLRKAEIKDMDNEIKTFVYRTGQQMRKEVGAQISALRKRMIIVLASMVILIASITTVVVVNIDAKASSDPAVEQTAEAEEEPEEAPIAEIVTEAADTESIESYTTAAAQHKDIPIYGLASDDDGVMLLSIDDEDAENAEDAFIPADLGAVSDTSSESNDSEASSDTEETQASINNVPEPEFDSRLEEVADLIDDATAPDDVPSKLTFTYNKKMILDLDKENLVTLQKIVEAEACDQDIYGRMLVANVIINRIYAGFADSVVGVVFQRIDGSVQFAPTRKGGSYYTVTVSQKTKEAVERVLSGEDYSQGALYFFQRSATPEYKARWFDSELKYLFKYGTHEFYKEKK